MLHSKTNLKNKSNHPNSKKSSSLVNSYSFKRIFNKNQGNFKTQTKVVSNYSLNWNLQNIETQHKKISYWEKLTSLNNKFQPNQMNSAHSQAN